MTRSRERFKVGDRVVITIVRTEHAATVTHVGRVGCTVRVDNMVGPGLFRHEHEIYDAFNDETKP